MDIKEIALKVADSLRNKVDGISHMQSNQGLVAFAEALIAELAKQNEPVAEVLSLFPGEPDSYINARAIGVDPFNTWTFPQPGTKLYTIPPTAEQIANETSWQPIETAPKGERFLTTTKLSDGSFGQVGISHSFFCYEVNTRDWKIAGDDPCATHWMPLPTPPKRSMEGV